MFVELLPLLMLGFGLGLMHALDADHIMAVSMLANERPGFRRTLFYSGHWALGHGGVLLLCGALLFGLNLAVPAPLQHVAEKSVGALLIALGLWFFVQLRRDKLRFETHSHGEITHSHWHDGSQEHGKLDVHKPVLVGALHGLAGSAPALALVPAVANGEWQPALGYLLIFSLGVMLSMVTFGFGFAHAQRFLQHRYTQIFRLSRHVLALTSIGLGSFWLLQA